MAVIIGDSTNESSIKLHERVGFRRIDILRSGATVGPRNNPIQTGGRIRS